MEQNPQIRRSNPQYLTDFFAFFTLDYEKHFADERVRDFMRQTDEPIVRAGVMFQPIRGFLFAVAFYPLRSVFFGQKNGWLAMWIVLVIVGILSTFGPSPGSIEGLIYTVFPPAFQFLGLIEVLLQSLLLSLILCHWVTHPEKRWINWILGTAFLVAVTLIALGLLFGPAAA